MSRFESAKEMYSRYGVDVEKAMERLASAPLAIHCWQGDDVRGFDTDPNKPLTGGIQTTGNYPGRARTPEELMADLELMLKLSPGTKKMNLHACYAIFDDENGASRRGLISARSTAWAVTLTPPSSAIPCAIL